MSHISKPARSGSIYGSFSNCGTTGCTCMWISPFLPLFPACRPLQCCCSRPCTHCWDHSGLNNLFKSTHLQGDGFTFEVKVIRRKSNTDLWIDLTFKPHKSCRSSSKALKAFRIPCSAISSWDSKGPPCLYKCWGREWKKTCPFPEISFFYTSCPPPLCLQAIKAQTSLEMNKN